MTNYITASGVQQFSITIASGQTTGTVTLPLSVSLLAMILQNGSNPSVSANPAECFAKLSINTATSVVTATRNTGTAGTIVVRGNVIDPTSSLINSVQYISVTIAATATSGTASISAVTNNNTAVHLLGWTSNNTTYSSINENPVLSLSGTTLTASRAGGTTGTLTVAAAIYEFQGAVLNQSVQQISATTSSAVTSYTAAVASVVLNNTLCFYSGSSVVGVATNSSNCQQKGVLTNSTTFTVSTVGTIAQLHTYNVSIVELIAGILNSNVQRGTTTNQVSSTTGTSYLTPINIANSAITFLQNTTNETTAGLTFAMASTWLSATTVPILVQQAKGNGASPLTVTITATQPGSCIIVYVGFENNSATVTSVTDSASNTYIQVSGARGTDSVGANATDIWYFPNIGAGVTSVKVTVSATSPFVEVFEVFSIASTSVIATSGNVTNGASGTTNVSAALTTSTSPTFILAGFMNAGAGATSVNAPYTIDTLYTFCGYHISSGTVSAESCTFNVSPATTYASSSAAFNFTMGEIVTLTKAQTAELDVGSWEVGEFIGFVAPSIFPMPKRNLTYRRFL